MARRRVTATPKAETGGDDQPSYLDAILNLESNYHQAQQWIDLASDILGKGHITLRSWAEAARTGGPSSKSAKSPADRPVPNAPPANPLQFETHQMGGIALPEKHTGEASNSLRIYCLGKFRVNRGNEANDSWSSNKAKGILKLLVLNLGKPLPKEIFLEAFWRDQPIQSANNSFRVAIHKLRQALGSVAPGSGIPRGGGHEYIISHGSNYSINIAAPLWVDIEEFESLWNAGRALERSGEYDEAIARYLSAASLYVGDLFEEDIYEEWTLIKRESLVDIYLSILRKISDYYFKAADYDTCIDFCQKTLEKDYCREDAYQLLIKCYIKLGLRSQALRWYRLCEDTLQRELDCPVSPETAALHNILTANDRWGESPELILD